MMVQINRTIVINVFCLFRDAFAAEHICLVYMYVFRCQPTMNSSNQTNALTATRDGSGQGPATKTVGWRKEFIFVC